MSKDAGKYLRFGMMILTSMVVMFVLMYLNSYQASHVQWSETRFYMTLIMGAAMAIVMLGYMWHMYKSGSANWAIVTVSVVVLAGALYLVRSQSTVQDQSWMKAMIPHHSIAILTSERAQIDDVRVRELADAIIEANGPAITESMAKDRPVPEFRASS